jgi:uncharacterized protein involved in outer membrane biogenesis
VARILKAAGMRRRVWVFAGVGLGLVGLVVVAIAAWPAIVRAAVVAAVGAATGRPVAVEAVSLDPARGRLAVRGLRIGNRDGTPFADVARLDAHVDTPALLRGHLHVRDLGVHDSTVRVVRFTGGEFNFSDLVRGGGSTRKRLDVTVDRFTLTGGTVSLEDRMLSPVRTWRSEHIVLDARGLSTLKGGGTAVGSSTLDGSPIAVRVDDLRLHPVQLRAVVDLRDVDLAVARLYLPPDAPVTLERGRLDTRVTVSLDARAGLRVDADGRMADVVVLRRHQQDPFVTASDVRLALRDLTAGADGLALARVELAGDARVFDPDIDPPARFDVRRVRAVAEALSWPVRGPARVELSAVVPGDGDVTARGTVSVRPGRAQLAVRLRGLKLAAWAQYLPSTARVTGRAEAAVDVVADLDGDLRARATGSAAIADLLVADGDRPLVRARRAEARGVEARWPLALTIERVRLTGPAVRVERDAAGELSLVAMLSARRKSPRPTTEEPNFAPPATPAATPVAVKAVAVDDGAFTWSDAAVTPRARIELRGIRAVVEDGVWPPRAPVRLTARALTPGGGAVSLAGRVRTDTLGAELRVTANGVDVAPYQPYLPVRARLSGRADAQVDLELSRAPDLHATVRGRAAVVRLVLADGSRPVLTVARAEATGIEAAWPERVDIARVVVSRPAAFLERDERGAFPIRGVLAPAGTAARAETVTPSGAGSAGTGAASAPAFRLGELVIADGAMRFVDRTLSPAYTEELSALSARATGLGTGAGPPGRIDLRATIGPAGALTARAVTGPLDAPLALELTAELRDFAVPRVNPYLRQYVAWTARDGRLSTVLRCRIAGEELEARSDSTLRRLEMARVAPDDPAQRRVGLPLGMIVSLLKDARGEIHVPLPVGGRLSDPQFDFHEAIWGAVRAITIRTIAAPVSWIGRLRFSRDSRIEDIEIDPVPFTPGTAELSAGGAAQVRNLSGFLRRSPATKMVLTPVVTLADVEALQTAALREEIARLAREQHLGEAAVAARLHAERFPGRPPPASVEAAIAALREDEPLPAREAERLARRRADAVRAALAEAGIDRARLEINPEAEALETSDGGRVDVALTDQVRPRRGLLAELLHRLATAIARLKTAREAPVAREPS